MIRHNKMNKVNEIRGIGLLLTEIETFATEIEILYSATEEIENKLKQKMKHLQKQLFIISMMINDEVTQQNLLDNKNWNIEMFSYLDEKSVLDGLIYIIYTIGKVQTKLTKHNITEFTQERIRNRIKSAHNIFKDMMKIYNDGEL